MKAHHTRRYQQQRKKRSSSLWKELLPNPSLSKAGSPLNESQCKYFSGDEKEHIRVFSSSFSPRYAVFLPLKETRSVETGLTMEWREHSQPTVSFIQSFLSLTSNYQRGRYNDQTITQRSNKVEVHKKGMPRYGGLLMMRNLRDPKGGRKRRKREEKESVHQAIKHSIHPCLFRTVSYRRRRQPVNPPAAGGGSGGGCCTVSKVAIVNEEKEAD